VQRWGLTPSSVRGAHDKSARNRFEPKQNSRRVRGYNAAIAREGKNSGERITAVKRLDGEGNSVARNSQEGNPFWSMGSEKEDICRVTAMVAQKKH